MTIFIIAYVTAGIVQGVACVVAMIEYERWRAALPSNYFPLVIALTFCVTLAIWPIMLVSDVMASAKKPLAPKGPWS